MSSPDTGPTATALPAMEPVALVDLLDRVLAKGIVVSGDLVISIADVDLVHVSLRAMLASADAHTPRIDSPDHDRIRRGE